MICDCTCCFALLQLGGPASPLVARLVWDLFYSIKKLENKKLEKNLNELVCVCFFIGMLAIICKYNKTISRLQLHLYTHTHTEVYRP
jgi:hypothetical protein